jgi:hypothetical protein
MVMVVIHSESSPPVRITPPGIVIVIGIGLVIVFRPKVDLLGGNKGISIIHLAERFDLLSCDFSCHSDLFSSPEDVGICIVIDEN